MSLIENLEFIKKFGIKKFIGMDLRRCGGIIQHKVDSQNTICRVTCRHCNHEWTYMGIRLAGLERLRELVKVQCPRIHNRVKMIPKNAR